MEMKYKEKFFAAGLSIFKTDILFRFVKMSIKIFKMTKVGYKSSIFNKKCP